MNKMFAEIVDWYGAVAIVGAYALNSFSVITFDSLSYQLLNLTGAIGDFSHEEGLPTRSSKYCLDGSCCSCPYQDFTVNLRE